MEVMTILAGRWQAWANEGQQGGGGGRYVPMTRGGISGNEGAALN